MVSCRFVAVSASPSWVHGLSRRPMSSSGYSATTGPMALSTPIGATTRLPNELRSIPIRHSGSCRPKPFGCDKFSSPTELRRRRCPATPVMPIGAGRPWACGVVLARRYVQTAGGRSRQGDRAGPRTYRRVWARRVRHRDGAATLGGCVDGRSDGVVLARSVWADIEWRRTTPRRIMGRAMCPVIDPPGPGTAQPWKLVRSAADRLAAAWEASGAGSSGVCQPVGWRTGWSRSELSGKY
jgi:hypothetical protein